MKGLEYVLLFCTVIMAERRKEYPRPSRGYSLRGQSSMLSATPHVALV